MSFRAAVRLAFLAAPACVYVSMACTPSSFDFITGGVTDAGSEASTAPVNRTETPTLAAPRPLAPISGAIIDGSRPKFRWALPPRQAGARVELCRDRACGGEKKTFDGTGLELTIAEDLAPGIWFWRVYGATGDAVGTTASVTWELLIRGGSHDPSPVSGTFVDIDGDGKADLVITGVFSTGPDEGFDVTAYLATNDDSTDFVTTDTYGGSIPSPYTSTDDPSFAVADVNGDGFGDITYGSTISADGAGILTSFGGSPYDSVGMVDYPSTLPFPATLVLHEGADIDGDGYGDVVVSIANDAQAIYGTSLGLGPVVPFAAGAYDDAGVHPATIPLTAGFGFDDPDRGSIAFATGATDAPLVILLPRGTHSFGGFTPLFSPPVPGPSRLAHGDLDGDGLSDIVMLTTVEAKVALCIMFGKDKSDNVTLHCSPQDAPALGFGAESMVTADTDGDGTDEILVGSTTDGVSVFHWNGTDLQSSHVGGPDGTRITTILPGWKGQPATWATTRSDGASIAIYKGTTLAKTILPNALSQQKRFGKAIR